jgi:hypothetical protein
MLAILKLTQKPRAVGALHAIVFHTYKSNRRGKESLGRATRAYAGNPLVIPEAQSSWVDCMPLHVSQAALAC